MSLLKHVAIIMDGNGRWGLKKKNSRKYGHIKGIEAAERILKKSISLNISYLTLFVFSTENWKRPNKEINFLFTLLKNYFKKNLSKIINYKVKVSIIGNRKKLPSDTIEMIKKIEKLSKNNKKINLIIAFNYGSREEIIQACKKLLSSKKRINESNFKKKLYSSKFPDPDILIRTGGKNRLSNFLLWQSAYSEIFFLKKLWPDFNEKDFEKIVKKFHIIKRNYGGL